MNYEELKEAWITRLNTEKKFWVKIPQYSLLLSPKIKTLLYQI